MSSAIKIADDLAAAARAESDLMNRSMTEQVEHWARIGRALERAPGVSMARIRDALAAETDFDTLSADERAVALGALESATFNPRGDRDLQRDKRRKRQPYTVLDDQGRVVEVAANGRKRVIADVDAYADIPDSAA